MDLGLLFSSPGWVRRREQYQDYGSDGSSSCLRGFIGLCFARLYQISMKSTSSTIIPIIFMMVEREQKSR